MPQNSSFDVYVFMEKDPQTLEPTWNSPSDDPRAVPPTL